MEKLMKSVLILVNIVGLLWSNTQTIAAHSGTLYIKKIDNSTSNLVNENSSIGNGDTLYIQPKEQASCFINGTIYCHLDNSCKIIFNQENKKITLTVIQGQLIFQKDPTKSHSIFEVSANNCIVIPEGTIAAVRIIPDVGPSVAVLEGSVRMKSPNGIIQMISAGYYCSYQTNTNQFGAINKLPQSTENILRSQVDTEVTNSPDHQTKGEDTSVSTRYNEPDQSTEIPPNTIISSPNKGNTDDPGSMAKQDINNDNESEEPPTLAEKEAPTKSKNDKKQDKPEWGLNAGVVTIDNELWTRLALSVDIPIWRFGVCFDVELFLDKNGNFSNKGWNFDSWRNTGESLLRKIKYIRFNHENDPFYAKVGGLDKVTLGYGFIVDRLTNMLDYPGEKLFGFHGELNNLSPIGITFHTVIPDFKEFADEGGILASRLALTPFQSLPIPIVNKMSIGGTFAVDINQYAPARQWDFSLSGSRWDRDEDGITDSTYVYTMFKHSPYYDSIVKIYKDSNDYDVLVENKDHWAKEEHDIVMVTGADIIFPLVKTKLLSLDLYGQMGMLIDDENDDKILKGWGFGAPGVALKFAFFWARAEFRHIQDTFEAEYFNTYYLRDRIIRSPDVIVKESTLPKINRNGIFGYCGFNILDFLVLDGRGQYMASKKDSNDNRESDIRFDATLSFGDLLLARIPKINKIQVFYYQSDIEGNLFKKSATTHWGYTLGLEVFQGASLEWKTDYGWKKDLNGTWKDNKVVTITAGLLF